MRDETRRCLQIKRAPSRDRSTIDGVPDDRRVRGRAQELKETRESCVQRMNGGGRLRGATQCNKNV